MQPILGNLGTAKGKGGNELIDVDEALGFKLAPVTSGYDERDLVALRPRRRRRARSARHEGAAVRLRDERRRLQDGADVRRRPRAEGRCSTWPRRASRPRAFTTASTASSTASSTPRSASPWPTHGKLTHTIKIKDIFDKGKNALVITAITTKDEHGDRARLQRAHDVRARRGRLGRRARARAPRSNVAPTRAPDATVEEKTSPNQALLYRLSGDWNPLHADPGFAKNFGFEQPILHGLCSFGFAARHVVVEVLPERRSAVLQEHQGALRRHGVPGRDARDRDVEGERPGSSSARR